jgi:hypothetical protein
MSRILTAPFFLKRATPFFQIQSYSTKKTGSHKIKKRPGKVFPGRRAGKTPLSMMVRPSMSMSKAGA